MAIHGWAMNFSALYCSIRRLKTRPTWNRGILLEAFLPFTINIFFFLLIKYGLFIGWIRRSRSWPAIKRLASKPEKLKMNFLNSNKIINLKIKPYQENSKNDSYMQSLYE